jgi:hypothetical protein
MKIFNKLYILFTFLILLIGVGCESVLEEVSVSDITSDSYYKTPAGFEDLVRSCYPLLRDITQTRELVMQGTDIFTDLAWTEGINNGAVGSPLNLYDIRLNSAMGELSTLWDILYREVGRTNTVVSRQDNVVGMNPDLLNTRVGEAKFLRALSYFYLVQQWGDIPMPITETVSAEKAVVKVASSEVYSQIIQDLTEAEAVLPVTASDYGRVTKGAAQFLLSKVYLTRGWNYNNSLGGSADDFNKALQLADKVIAAYPLAADYTDLFPKHSENPLTETFPAQNDQNPEIVFAVQYSDDVLTFGGDVTGSGEIQGNDYHSIFGGGIEELPGQLGRSGDYNRHLNKFTTTPAMYRSFDPDIDTRYHHNFVDAIVALKAVPNFKPVIGDPSISIDIAQGDTVVQYRAWNNPASPAEKGMDVGGDKPYAVINTDEFSIIEKSAYHGDFQQPLMWKFWQPGLQYGDDFGTFDFALFRSAEAYLIAAEAIVKGATGGTLGGAEVYYNKVLDRALGAHAGAEPMRAANPADVSSIDAVSYRATAANINVNMILDERARELMGEYMRWYDLKRTGTLISRTKAWNPWTNFRTDLTERHLVRPIPQHEIDRSSPPISQNEGY